MYIDSAAIEEVINKGEGIKGNLKKLVDQYEALKTDLPEDVKQQLEEKVPGLGESAEDNMKEMIRQGVDPDVALNLLNNEQYQQQLLTAAVLEAKFNENPIQYLKECGIELKDGETIDDAKETAAKAWQWLSSVAGEDSNALTSEGEGFSDDVQYSMKKNETGEYEVTFTSGDDSMLVKNDSQGIVRYLLQKIDARDNLIYSGNDLKSLTLQGLMDARKFIDSIPADDINKVQAAVLGLQLATGGPVKLVLGYAIAKAAESVFGDSVRVVKDKVAEEVAAVLESGSLTAAEFKLINCPEGDCSDKYASAGSYVVNMDKDNVKFGMNIIIGVVGSIISEKVFQSKYGSKIADALKRFPDDVKPNLVVNMNKQRKHLPGTNEYKTASISRNVKSPIRPEVNVQDLIVKYAGTGEKRVGIFGQSGYKELVTSNVIVGDYIANGKNWGPTKNFTIHYAKDGVHIVPARP